MAILVDVPNLGNDIMVKQKMTPGNLFSGILGIQETLTILPSTEEVEKLKRLMRNVLKPSEEIILRMRFGIDTPFRTLKEIGDKFGISDERVRIVQNTGLRKLRLPYVRGSKAIQEVAEARNIQQNQSTYNFQENPQMLIDIVKGLDDRRFSEQQKIDQFVSVLPIGDKGYNGLMNYSLSNPELGMKDFISMDFHDLMKIKNVGAKTANEILRVLRLIREEMPDSGTK